MIPVMGKGRELANWTLAAAAFLLAGAVSATVLSYLKPELVWEMLGTGPTPAQEFRVPHPVYHHALKPEVIARLQNRERRRELVEYRVNSFGMRDPERSIPKPPGTFRILMLGDSFVEGYNVGHDDTVSVQMESLLNEGSPVPVEVVNGGVVSRSPLLHYLFLKETGALLEPDLVVLNLDMSDIQDDLGYGLTAQFDDAGRPVRVESRSPRAGVLDFEEVFRRLGRERKELYTDRFFHTRDEARLEDLLPSFENTWSYIQMTADLSAGLGAFFLLVAYPYGHQVDEREWGEGRKQYHFERRTYEGPLFAFLEERSREEGIAFLSLLEGFRSSPVRPLFFDRDGHWNEEGHFLAATLIGEEIVRGKFIGAAAPRREDTPAALFQRASTALAAGEREEAWRLAEKILEAERTAEGLNLAGRIRSALSDPVGARALHEEALAVGENPESHYRLGFIALRVGDREGAERHWRNTVALAEHFGMVDYNLGIFLVEEGRTEDALPHLRWAAESGDAGADGWNALGIALGMKGDIGEAKRAFGKALEIDPGHGGARANLEMIP